MNKTLKYLAGITLIGASSLMATVTLQIRSQLANTAGVATNGMNWGVAVDTAGNGWQATAGLWNGMVTNASGLLTYTDGGAPAAGITGDDYYNFSVATANNALYGGTGVANQYIMTLGVNGINAGDNFGLVWSVTNTSAIGDRYGFYTDNTNLVTPADGATVSYQAALEPADPIVAAGTFVGVPEPSTYAAIFGLAALGAAYIRRRK